MSLLRRYGGVEAAREFAASRQSGEGAVPVTDANGYYDGAMDPDAFANRVLSDVRERGDAAVKKLTAALDGVELDNIEITAAEIEGALGQVSTDELDAMRDAAKRVDAFQRRNLPSQWFDADMGYGELVRPVGSVGCYVPGGTAPLASTVIMTAVPALAAGVQSVCVATPAGRDGLPDPAVLAACHIAGVRRVFAVGGVPAIAALAVGTESVPRVDMICGPGNVWVTAAKKAVYGLVGIEGIYGPTETMVVIDESSSPDLAAADLIAQAEHDVMALPILVALSEESVRRVEVRLEGQLAGLPRGNIARASVERNGAAFIVDNLSEAVEVANAIAPEHLCLGVSEADHLIDRIQCAGGLFLGEWSAEVMGDYVGGPSHVMPTGGSSKWSSALSARDFVRVMPVLNLTEEQFLALSTNASTLARLETLEGHAAASDVRRRRSLGE